MIGRLFAYLTFAVFAILPITNAWRNGALWLEALIYVGTGIALYTANVALIQRTISRSDPDFDHSRWEETAGLGIVPKWISFLGMAALGLIVAGAVVAVLLLIGAVEER